MSLLEVSGLKKIYTTRLGGNQVEALRNVNFTVEEGEYIAIMGESGSGKTTLLRILMGLETADSGQLFMERVPIGAVFQEDRLCESFSAVDNVLMTSPSSVSRAEARRELMELLPEEVLDRPVATLSGGQKRRVAICRALCASSELLILDEPFTGLDAGTKADVIRYLQKKSAGKLTLLSTHQEEDILALDGIQITI